jgi:type IV secretory pathway VirB10-like protein
VAVAAAVSEPEPRETTEESADRAGGDAQLARQLVELLKQGSAAGESPQGKVSDRDMYDFIRLSLRYHQRHVERFVLGIVVGVALLAAGGLWTLITWQNDQLMPSAVASNPPAYSAAETALEIPPLPLQPAVAGAMIDSTAAQPQSSAALPALAPAAPEQRSAPVPPVSRSPEPEPEAVKQSTLDPAIAAENRALVREHERLERERRKLKKQLQAERARREELRQEAEAEQERARKAQLLIQEARKSARAAWDHIDAETPDAFPEE